MRRFLAGAMLACAVMLVACTTAETADGPDASIAPEALAARIADGRAPIVLDVRTPAEYEKGHIPGAVLIPHDALASRLDELPDRDAEIVVHCHSGRRAGIAEDLLRDAGYTNLVALEGHWQAWQAGGHPTQ